MSRINNLMHTAAGFPHALQGHPKQTHAHSLKCMQHVNTKEQISFSLQHKPPTIITPTFSMDLAVRSQNCAWRLVRDRHQIDKDSF